MKIMETVYEFFLKYCVEQQQKKRNSPDVYDFCSLKVAVNNML